MGIWVPWFLGSRVGIGCSQHDSSSALVCAEQGPAFQAVSKYLLKTHDMLLTANVTLRRVFFGSRSVILCSWFRFHFYVEEVVKAEIISA